VCEWKTAKRQQNAFFETLVKSPFRGIISQHCEYELGAGKERLVANAKGSAHAHASAGGCQVLSSTPPRVVPAWSNAITAGPGAFPESWVVVSAARLSERIGPVAGFVAYGFRTAR
jgi:hypothetical protein